MALSFDQEKREFVRIKLAIPIRYKFLAENSKDPRLDKSYQGSTSNISGGGLLLAGPIPDPNWIPDILLQRIVIGINFLLPDQDSMVKAITRASWIEARKETSEHWLIGLRFKEITQEDKEKIFQFIIKSQLPGH